MFSCNMSSDRERNTEGGPKSSTKPNERIFEELQRTWTFKEEAVPINDVRVPEEEAYLNYVAIQK